MTANTNGLEARTPAHSLDLGSPEPTSRRPDDDFDEWSKDALYARAKELGIAGRSDMNKAQLIEALRAH